MFRLCAKLCRHLLELLQVVAAQISRFRNPSEIPTEPDEIMGGARCIKATEILPKVCLAKDLIDLVGTLYEHPSRQHAEQLAKQAAPPPCCLAMLGSVTEHTAEQRVVYTCAPRCFRFWH